MNDKKEKLVSIVLSVRFDAAGDPEIYASSVSPRSTRIVFENVPTGRS